MKIIDGFDKQIITALTKPNTTTPDYTQLSKILKKPKTTVYGRIKRLQEAGILTGFKPLIHTEENTVTAFMLIRVTNGTDVNKLAENLIKQKEITEINYVTGNWCMILKVQVTNNSKYFDFSTKIVKDFPEITDKLGMIAPKTLK